MPIIIKELNIKINVEDNIQLEEIKKLKTVPGKKTIDKIVKQCKKEIMQELKLSARR